MAKKKKENNFEQSLKRLEEIGDLLESEELGLDDSITLYEEGIKLSKLCISKVKKAELKITQLKEELSETTFDEE